MSTVTHLDWTYLVTGPYSDLYFSEPLPGRFEAGGFSVRQNKACLLGDGKGRVSFTTMAEYDDFHEHQYVKLTSHTVSGDFLSLLCSTLHNPETEF